MTSQDLNLTVESQEVYRARDKDYLTSTLLKTFLDNPRKFQKQRAGEIEREEKKAWRDGTAAHALILEGSDVYHDRYAVNNLDGRTVKGKEWRFDVEKRGLIVLDEKTDSMIRSMDGELQRHPVAPILLKSGFPELVARATYCDYPCQVKVDWLHFGLLWNGEPCNVLIDYKTCKDIKWFFSDAKKLKYVNSFSFYKSVLNNALPRGREIDRVLCIFQEKKPPYTVGVWEVHLYDLETARMENEDAIIRIMECDARGVYPTGYEEIRTMELLRRKP